MKNPFESKILLQLQKDTLKSVDDLILLSEYWIFRVGTRLSFGNVQKSNNIYQFPGNYLSICHLGSPHDACLALQDNGSLIFLIPDNLMAGISMPLPNFAFSIELPTSEPVKMKSIPDLNLIIFYYDQCFILFSIKLGSNFSNNILFGSQLIKLDRFPSIRSFPEIPLYECWGIDRSFHFVLSSRETRINTIPIVWTGSDPSFSLEPTKSILTEHRSWITCLSKNHDHSIFASGDFEGKVILWTRSAVSPEGNNLNQSPQFDICPQVALTHLTQAAVSALLLLPSVYSSSTIELICADQEGRVTLSVIRTPTHQIPINQVDPPGGYSVQSLRRFHMIHLGPISELIWFPLSGDSGEGTGTDCVSFLGRLRTISLIEGLVLETTCTNKIRSLFDSAPEARFSGSHESLVAATRLLNDPPILITALDTGTILCWDLLSQKLLTSVDLGIAGSVVLHLSSFPLTDDSDGGSNRFDILLHVGHCTGDTSHFSFLYETQQNNLQTETSGGSLSDFDYREGPEVTQELSETDGDLESVRFEVEVFDVLEPLEVKSIDDISNIQSSQSPPSSVMTLPRSCPIIDCLPHLTRTTTSLTSMAVKSKDSTSFLNLPISGLYLSTRGTYLAISYLHRVLIVYNLRSKTPQFTLELDNSVEDIGITENPSSSISKETIEEKGQELFSSLESLYLSLLSPRGVQILDVMNQNILEQFQFRFPSSIEDQKLSKYSSISSCFPRFQFLHQPNVSSPAMEIRGLVALDQQGVFLLSTSHIIAKTLEDDSPIVNAKKIFEFPIKDERIITGKVGTVEGLVQGLAVVTWKEEEVCFLVWTFRRLWMIRGNGPESLTSESNINILFEWNVGNKKCRISDVCLVPIPIEKGSHSLFVTLSDGDLIELEL